jgi:hypothetical protein
VVEDVRLDRDAEHPRALVVVVGWGRRWLVIPTDAVVEIAPAERRLTVRQPIPEHWLEGGHRPLRRPGKRRGVHGVLKVLRRVLRGVSRRP